MKTITRAQLIEHNACEAQINLFKERFKESVDITEDLAASVANVFDVCWVSNNLLSPTAKIEYKGLCAPAWTDYKGLCEAALKDYAKVCAPAWAEYERLSGIAFEAQAEGSGPAWTEYARLCAPAWAEYERVCAPAEAEYDRLCARIFARLYNAS